MPFSNIIYVTLYNFVFNQRADTMNISINNFEFDIRQGSFPSNKQNY